MLHGLEGPAWPCKHWFDGEALKFAGRVIAVRRVTSSAFRIASVCGSAPQQSKFKKVTLQSLEVFLSIPKVQTAFPDANARKGSKIKRNKRGEMRAKGREPKRHGTGQKKVWQVRCPGSAFRQSKLGSSEGSGQVVWRV